MNSRSQHISNPAAMTPFLPSFRLSKEWKSCHTTTTTMYYHCSFVVWCPFCPVSYALARSVRCMSSVSRRRSLYCYSSSYYYYMVIFVMRYLEVVSRQREKSLFLLHCSKKIGNPNFVETEDFYYVENQWQRIWFTSECTEFDLIIVLRVEVALQEHQAGLLSLFFLCGINSEEFPRVTNHAAERES